MISNLFIFIGVLKIVYAFNSPPSLRVTRRWDLTEDEPIGSVVARMKVHDADGDPVEVRLGKPSTSAFNSDIDGATYFTIDNNLRVKLNKSLDGLAGVSFLLGIIATDGHVPYRVDVLVEVRRPNEPPRAIQTAQTSFVPDSPPPDLNRIRSPDSGPGPPILHMDPYTVWNVSYDDKIGTRVYVIEAMSFRGAYVRYTITPSDLLEVDEETGEVFVKADLSNKIGTYNIDVKVSDYVESINETAILKISMHTSEEDMDDRDDGFPSIPINPIPKRPEVKKSKPTYIVGTTKQNPTNGNQLTVIETVSPDSVPHPKEEEKEIGWTIVILVLTLGGIPLLLVSLFLLLRWKKKKNQKAGAKESVVSYSGKRSASVLISERGSSVLNGIFNMVGIHKRAESNTYSDDSAKPTVPSRKSSKHEAMEPDHWEVDRHKLRVMGILGEGCFGQVWKYEATDFYESSSKNDAEKDVPTKSYVAVKTLKESACEEERKDLLQELKVLKSLGSHPNVVALLGCCTEKEPIFIILEYMIGGKLQSYLKSSRAGRSYDNLHGVSGTLSPKDLTIFALQIAKGMDFLSKKGIIHRDLAARNILVGEDKTCKVADFGFARDVANERVYERKSDGRLPIRWMAPESLFDNIFMTKSDVWSFGILLWEIVTLGATPYPGHSAGDVMKKVKEGYRLEKPNHCKREVYNIMYYCWDADQEQRPSFSEIVQTLEKLILTEVDYIQLDNFTDHEYYNVISEVGELL